LAWAAQKTALPTRTAVLDRFVRHVAQRTHRRWNESGPKVTSSAWKTGLSHAVQTGPPGEPPRLRRGEAVCDVRVPEAGAGDAPCRADPGALRPRGVVVRAGESRSAFAVVDDDAEWSLTRCIQSRHLAGWKTFATKLKS
jgi:hypothetical protein